MNTQLRIISHEGKFAVDSREVAQMVEKLHAHLIRDIRNYVEVLENSPDPKLDPAQFFIESTYFDEQKQERACYLLTRKGCDMVANKMTGEKGILFTAAYVTKFEEMEKTLTINPYQGLSKELQAIFANDKKLQAVEARVDKLENTMTVDYGQQEELRALANKVVIKALGGKGTPAYKLAPKAFSEFWNAYKAHMGVNSYKNTPAASFDKAIEFVNGWKPSDGLKIASQLLAMGATASEIYTYFDQSGKNEDPLRHY